MVLWVEDGDGNLIETLYVTRKYASQSWKGPGPHDLNKTFRVESLPYWQHKWIKKGFYSPTRNNPLPDAITGASPPKESTVNKSFIIEGAVAASFDEVAVFLEVNVAYDGNDAFPAGKKRGMPVSGQPAVVYRAKVDLRKPGVYPMRIIGHSSPSGRDGNLYSDLSGMTTALRILDDVKVVIK